MTNKWHVSSFEAWASNKDDLVMAVRSFDDYGDAMTYKHGIQTKDKFIRCAVNMTYGPPPRFANRRMV